MERAKDRPEVVAAYRHMVECARAFVRCADEFGDDLGATAEHFDALERAQDRLAREWDGPSPLTPADELLVVDCHGAEVFLPAETRLVPFMDAIAALQTIVPALTNWPVIGAGSPCARTLDAVESVTLEAIAATRAPMVHGFARYPDGAWRQVCVWEWRGRPL